MCAGCSIVSILSNIPWKINGSNPGIYRGISASYSPVYISFSFIYQFLYIIYHFFFFLVSVEVFEYFFYFFHFFVLSFLFLLDFEILFWVFPQLQTLFPPRTHVQTLILRFQLQYIFSFFLYCSTMGLRCIFYLLMLLLFFQYFLFFL